MNKRIIKDSDVVEYIRSQSGSTIVYFLLFEGNNEMKKLKRIKAKETTYSSPITLKRENIVNVEECILKDSDFDLLSPTVMNFKNSTVLVSPGEWSQVELSNDGLNLETFDGMLLHRSWMNNYVYFINTSNIIHKGVINIVNFDVNSNVNSNAIASNSLDRYACKIRDEMNVLDSELSMKRDEYERELDDMRNERRKNIEKLKRDYETKIKVLWKITKFIMDEI